jgi:hypothetical protein
MVSNGVFKMQTVVETPSYLKKAEALFSAEEREGNSGSESRLAMVSSDPECGDLIQGTGGFRKVGLAAAEWENAVEGGSFTFSVTNAFRYSLWPPMQRMRKKA